MRLRRRRVLGSFGILFMFVLVFVGVIGGAMVFSFSDDAGYLFLNSNTRRARASVVKFTTNIHKSLGGANSNDEEDSPGSVGLDLLLIDKLEEGYIKELLTLYRDSYAGKFYSSQFHASVSELLGMQVTETGTYAGTDIPKSYIPYSDDKVQWGVEYNGVSADNMKLLKIDSTIVEYLPGNGLKGGVGDNADDVTPFCFRAASWASLDGAKANVNGAGNANRGPMGDYHFLPDVVSAVNKRYSKVLIDLGLTSDSQVSDTLGGCVLSTQHNRGIDAVASLGYGVAYNPSGGADSYLDTNKSGSSEMVSAVSSIATLIDNYNSSAADKSAIVNKTGASNGRWIAVALAVKADGWYISDYTYASVNSAAVECWNAVWPNDKAGNVTALRSKMKDKLRDVKDAIKEVTGDTVSAEDTTAVYGTSSDYDDCPYFTQYPSNQFGYVYHVSKIKSNVYKNKYSNGEKPYIVSGYDIVCAGHNVSVAMLGQYVYAKLLKLGGLTSVDPTNPSTYLEGLKTDAGGTYVPSGSTDWMKAFNIDVSKLTPAREALLNTAYNITKTDCKYAQAGGTMDSERKSGKTPTLLDCSGFICRAYYDTGFTGFERVPTAGYPAKTSMFSCISASTVLPGDIMVFNDGHNRGHALMYLAGRGSQVKNYTVMQSTTGGQNGPQIGKYGASRSVDVAASPDAKNDGVYHFYKYKNIDASNISLKVTRYN